MDIISVVLILVVIMLLFSTNSPGWGPGWTRFNGANVVWTILLILLVVWMLRRLL